MSEPPAVSAVIRQTRRAGSVAVDRPDRSLPRDECVTPIDIDDEAIGFVDIIERGGGL